MTFNSRGPLIQEFRTSRNPVAKGQSFTLSWKVDADKVELHRNGIYLHTAASSQRSLDRTEFYDGTKDVIYELVVFKDGMQLKSKQLFIRFESGVGAGSSSSARTEDASNLLVRSAPWALSLAILSLICCAIFVIGFIVIIVTERTGMAELLLPLFGIGCVFPQIYLLNFATGITMAINRSDEYRVEIALRNLKRYFIWVLFLIITFIAGLLLYLLSTKL